MATNTSWRSPIDRPACVAIAEVDHADPLHRRLDRVAIGVPQPVERRIVRQPAERDDLVDRHREWELGELGHDGDRPGDRLVVDPADRGAAQKDGPGPRLEDARQDPQERRFPGPVRADEREPLTRVDREVDVVDDPPLAVRDGDRRRPPGSRSQLVPGTGLGQQDQEERRAEHGHDHADREIAEQPRDDVRRHQQAGADRSPRSGSPAAPARRRAAAPCAAPPARRTRSGR